MSTRTRSRYMGAGQITTVRWPFNTPPYYGGIQTETNAIAGEMLNEVIIDVPKKGGEKPCKHTYWSVKARIAPLLTMNYTYEYKSSRMFKYGGYALFEDLRFKPWPTMETLGATEMKSMATEAVRRMEPSMNNGLSLVNFLLELKDLKRMFHLWEGRTVGGLRAFKREIERQGLAGLTGGSKELAKALTFQTSSYYLNWNFGWKPFIDDIISMVKALRHFERKYKWLRANSGKVLRKNYRRKLDWALPSVITGSQRQNLSVTGIGIPDTWLDLSRKTCRWVYPPTYHATMVYRYSMSEDNGTAGKVKAFLSAMGVELNPQIIWNAIPFSFLIDWLIDVGAFLRTLKLDNLGIRTEVLDFSHSVKFHIVATTDINPYGGSAGYKGYYPIRDDEYSYYERVKVIPDLYALSVEAPSFKQWTLAGALAGVRMPSYRKHIRRASRLDT